MPHAIVCILISTIYRTPLYKALKIRKFVTIFLERFRQNNSEIGYFCNRNLYLIVKAANQRKCDGMIADMKLYLP